MSKKYVIKGLTPVIPLPKQSLGSIIFNSLLLNKSNNKAIIEANSDESVTYSQLLKRTCKIAEALRNVGLQEDDVISIYSENNLNFIQVIISALYLGAVVAPINYMYTSGELLHVISISKPKLIFCSKNCIHNLLKIKEHIAFIEKIIVFELCDGFELFEDFINFNYGFNEQSFSPIDDIDIDNQTAIILCSSGTTGLPKGVMITHKNIACRLAQIDDTRLTLQRKDQFILVPAPLFHAFGLFTTMGFLVKSLTIIIMSKYQEEAYLSCIEKYQINSLWIVPTIANFLAKSVLVDKYNLSSVKEVACATAPLKKEVEETLKQRLNVSLVRQMYGLTETTFVVLLTPLNEDRHGSVGKVVPHMEAKVVDLETNKLLGPNQCGELHFRGDFIMKGYYRNSEATAATIDKDGWLHTGDIGYFDEDAYFFIVDRQKDIIKYKGYQVAPAELEKVILTHPKILDVGVIGIPHRDAGEVPVAFVVKQPNVNLSETEVQDFVRRQVSPQKRLHGGVIFVNQLPRNAVGKLLRRELRQMIQTFKSKF